MISVVKNISFGLSAAVLTLGAFGAGVYGTALLTTQNLSAAAAQSQIRQVMLPDNALTAKSAVLYELGTGRVLYQKNAHEQLPLASLTKLMSIEIVLSLKSADTPVQITRDNIAPDGDSGLRAGQTTTLGDLIKFAIVASSNDAMEAAAASIGNGFINKMNEAAAAKGLTKTHFFNVTGLDINTKASGAYGSAYDVARLAALFYRDHPDFFELTTRADVSIDQNGKELKAKATALPLQNIPGFVAAKTGYTDLAGGNLVAVFDLEPGHTVIAAVLGSTRDGRFSDVDTIIKTARKALTP